MNYVTNIFIIIYTDTFLYIIFLVNLVHFNDNIHFHDKKIIKYLNRINGYIIGYLSILHTIIIF